MGKLELANLDTYSINALYHMTHIDNLYSILKYGLLSHGNKFQKEDISNRDVNSRRSVRDPLYRRPLHSYVPFYFNPRNAMLYVQGYQDDIVILEVEREIIFEEGAMFTDGNAASSGTSFYNDIAYLSQLNWSCLRSKYWNDFADGKRQMMAEVLVPNQVRREKIKRIVCNSAAMKQKIDMLTMGRIPCAVDYRLYF